MTHFSHNRGTKIPRDASLRFSTMVLCDAALECYDRVSSSVLQLEMMRGEGTGLRGSNRQAVKSDTTVGWAVQLEEDPAMKRRRWVTCMSGNKREKASVDR